MEHKIFQLLTLIGIFVLFSLFLTRIYFHSKNKNNTFNPILLFFGVVTYFYIIPAIYLYMTSNYAWHSEIPNRDILVALLVVLLFSTLVSISYLYLPEIKVYLIKPHINQSDSRYIFFAGLLWILIGLVSYTLFVSLNGGFASFLTGNRALQTVPNTQRYKILAWAGLWSGLPLIIPSSHELYKNMNKRQGRLFVYFIGLLVLVVIIATFSFRSRLKAAYPIIYFLLYFHHQINKISFKGFGVIAALGAIGVGGFTLIEYIIIGKNTSLQLLINGLIYHLRFEPLIAVITEFSREPSFQFGTTFLYGGIWYDIGVTSLGDQIELILTGRNQPGFTISATVLGELYINYGMIGILFFGAVYGFLLKTIKTTLLESDNNVSKGLYPAILFITLAVVPTSIGWVLRNFVMVVLPPIIITLVVRQFIVKAESND